MKKNKITRFQYFTVFFFLLNAFIPTIGFHKLTMISKQDALFSILLGGGFMVLFVLLIKNIPTYLPNKTLFQKIKFLFPKSFFIYFFLFFVILTSLLFWLTQEFSGFVHFYLLPQLESFWIVLPFFLLLFYILKKPSETLFRTSEICFYFYILFFIISVLGILPQSNFLKIKPLLSSGIRPILESSLFFFFSLPLPFFLLLYFPRNTLKRKQEMTKTWIRTIFWSSMFLFVTLFLILSSIGIHLANLYKNPLMVTYQKISFLNILERVETTLSFSYILLYFFPITFLIYLLKELVLEIFPHHKKRESLILSLILIFVLLGNQFFSFRFDIYIIYLLFFFLLFLSTSIYWKKESSNT